MPPTATPRPDPKPVLAEHCFGITREGRWFPFTRLTTRALWIDGGTFIANVDGHRADGSVAERSNPYRAYVLTLAGAQPVPAVMVAQMAADLLAGEARQAEAA
jgi:hypothetical protein